MRRYVGYWHPTTIHGGDSDNLIVSESLEAVYPPFPLRYHNCALGHQCVWLATWPLPHGKFCQCMTCSFPLRTSSQVSHLPTHRLPFCPCRVVRVITKWNYIKTLLAWPKQLNLLLWMAQTWQKEGMTLLAWLRHQCLLCLTEVVSPF